MEVSILLGKFTEEFLKELELSIEFSTSKKTFAKGCLEHPLRMTETKYRVYLMDNNDVALLEQHKYGTWFCKQILPNHTCSTMIINAMAAKIKMLEEVLGVHESCE